MALRIARTGQLLVGDVEFAASQEVEVSLPTGGPWKPSEYAVAGLPVVAALDTVQIVTSADGETYAATIRGKVASVVAVGTVAATGQIDCDSGGAAVLPADTETFVLNDGTNPAVTFQFDLGTPVVETPTLREVDINAAASDDDVRDAIIAAINGAPTLAITASSGGAGLVALANDVPGIQGNVAIAETVAAAGFVVTGMAGGVGSTVGSIRTALKAAVDALGMSVTTANVAGDSFSLLADVPGEPLRTAASATTPANVALTSSCSPAVLGVVGKESAKLTIRNPTAITAKIGLVVAA